MRPKGDVIPVALRGAKNALAALFVVVAAAGCQSSGAVMCEDGTYCASDRVCDEAHGTCVVPEAFEVCANETDGTPCELLDVAEGFCDQGVCLPVLRECGNGTIETGESCDDGATSNGDGCSATCQQEPPASWLDVTPASSPPPGGGPSMAYDAARRKVVLFRSGDTWEWDGTSWVDVSPPAGGPSARGTPQMVYDAVRGRVILYGGVDGGIEVRDMWEWDGTNWTDITPATGLPTINTRYSMVYDAARQQGLLVNDLGETWTWDGSSWTKLSPAVSPPRRRGFGLAYDAGRQRVVLYSGYGGTTLYNDTWEWDGTNWVDVTPSSASPPPRIDHQMTYDAAFSRVIFFGGLDVDGRRDDTWAWDGTSWTDITPINSPPPRSGGAMVFDAARARIVLFGGVAAQIYGDTWTGIDNAEHCPEALDGDGDGLAGCADPDCWEYCTPECPPDTTCDPTAPHCGDAVCDTTRESCRLCPSDCGACAAQCGDFFCEGQETAASCPGDCSL